MNLKGKKNDLFSLIFICLFLFGCAVSLLLGVGFLVVASGTHPLVLVSKLLNVMTSCVGEQGLWCTRA